MSENTEKQPRWILVDKTIRKFCFATFYFSIYILELYQNLDDRFLNFGIYEAMAWFWWELVYSVQNMLDCVAK